MEDSQIHFKSFFSPTRVAVLVLAIYLLFGLLIFQDYGMSYDENLERKSSISNFVFVMGDRMLSSDSETVRNIALNAPPLETYRDRYYGTALQTIPLLVEYINYFEMPSREVFLVRHLFVFLNYYIAGIFFYLILRRRFGNTWIPVIGLFFYILYPRFFGESFYNIKDILFYAWIIISAYFILRWLEDFRFTHLLLSAITIAIATNTRILGLSLLLLACVFSLIINLVIKKERIPRTLLMTFLLPVLFFIFYTIITPIMWQNPFRTFPAIFVHFISFSPWNGTHFYLGEMITKEVPWHYLPVWMGVTIPLLYIVMFFIGVGALCYGINIWIKRRIDRPALYDIFFASQFFCTLLGFILLRISMYEGWRHAYILFVPFLYIAVFGFYKTSTYLRHNLKAKNTNDKLKNKPIPWYGLIYITAFCLLSQLVWIVINHPYQYVYFNLIGRQIAEKNFTLDYWEISHLDLILYVLANDDRSGIIIKANWFHGLLLSENERARVIFTNEKDEADYIVQHTRIPYIDRIPPPGFEEVASITVDGIKISILYKRYDN